MKVLIVNAFACRKAFQKFDKLVRAGFETVVGHEQGQTDFTVRHFKKLEDFCYDNEAAGLASRAAIVAIDKLDFVFVDGDSRLLPWHPRARKLVVFLRTVIRAKKCLFASGPGAHVVAYVCATGGKMLRVLNGGGDGGSLLELASLRPEDLGSIGRPTCGGEAQEVVLDSTTGDFYGFDFKTDRWIAEGNVGIKKTKAGIGGVAAAILADACSSLGDNSCARKVPVNELLGIKRTVQGAEDISTKTLQRPNTPRRVVGNWVQGEVVVRVRPKSLQHRFLKHAHCGEFLAWSPGKWSIDESTTVRCRRPFAVLASSHRAGVEVLEIDNCLATRFNMRQEFKDAVGLLQAFVEHKHLLIRDRNRIDRGSDFVTKGVQIGDYFDGMSATSSLKQKGKSAQGTAQRSQVREVNASRRGRPQGGQRDTTAMPYARRRADTFPHRPQPTEKPRFAPPQSTRTIRGAARTTRGGARRVQSPQSILAENVVNGQVAGVGGAGGGNGCCDDFMAAVDNGLGGSDYRSPHKGGEGVHDGSKVMDKSRGVDPSVRRRMLVGRVGEGLGLDLSKVIGALLPGEESQSSPTEARDVEPSHTARTAPAACEHNHASGYNTDRTILDAGVGKDDYNQGTECQGTSRWGSETDVFYEEDSSGKDEMTGGVKPGFKVSAPRRGCSVAEGGHFGNRTRRNVVLVRIAGHDRRRPYNNFHRFKKMEEETRSVFFSLGDSVGTARVNDANAKRGGRQSSRTSRDDLSFANSTQQGIKGPAAQGRKTKQLFSANFGTKEAWTAVQGPALRTQGPYLDKNGTPRETREKKLRVVLHPRRWALSGAKRHGWSGIGEGAGFPKNLY